MKASWRLLILQGVACCSRHGEQRRGTFHSALVVILQVWLVRNGPGQSGFLAYVEVVTILGLWAVRSDI